MVLHCYFWSTPPLCILLPLGTLALQMLTVSSGSSLHPTHNGSWTEVLYASIGGTRFTVQSWFWVWTWHKGTCPWGHHGAMCRDRGGTSKRLRGWPLAHRFTEVAELAPLCRQRGPRLESQTGISWILAGGFFVSVTWQWTLAMGMVGRTSLRGCSWLIQIL